MRISDWSSDVCSSDLKACRAQVRSYSESRHPLDISSTPRAYPAAMHFSRERIRARLHLLQESLPAALARRFFETDLLTHAAALSFYALLSDRKSTRLNSSH